MFPYGIVETGIGRGGGGQGDYVAVLRKSAFEQAESRAAVQGDQFYIGRFIQQFGDILNGVIGNIGVQTALDLTFLYDVPKGYIVTGKEVFFVGDALRSGFDSRTCFGDFRSKSFVFC